MIIKQIKLSNAAKDKHKECSMVYYRIERQEICAYQNPATDRERTGKSCGKPFLTIILTL